MELPKPTAEQGRYFHPQAYGKPESLTMERRERGGATTLLMAERDLAIVVEGRMQGLIETK